MTQPPPDKPAPPLPDPVVDQVVDTLAQLRVTTGNVGRLCTTCAARTITNRDSDECMTCSRRRNQPHHRPSRSDWPGMVAAGADPDLAADAILARWPTATGRQLTHHAADADIPTAIADDAIERILEARDAQDEQ